MISPPLKTFQCLFKQLTRAGIILDLTLSLPRCHLKTANKSVKFEILKSFCLPFRNGMQGFPSKRTMYKIDLL